MTEAREATPVDATRFAEHRRELTAHCHRMLGSPFEADDTDRVVPLFGLPPHPPPET